ncbi:unnamed protein product [Symbiodinium natans]|uniref:Uncharacterized protein n=1 Tax=Symbiodinium natans TaxID=878477 RepID=A0A812UYE4_9DINO|nr:unnamed protein product [Symbiodinium natans]CAE7606578.1 unnamed protein product [Symbiodinium natans]
MPGVKQEVQKDQLVPAEGAKKKYVRDKLASQDDEKNRTTCRMRLSAEEIELVKAFRRSKRPGAYMELESRNQLLEHRLKHMVQRVSAYLRRIRGDDAVEEFLETVGA